MPRGKRTPAAPEAEPVAEVDSGRVKFDDFRKAIRSFKTPIVVTSYDKPIGMWVPEGTEAPRAATKASAGLPEKTGPLPSQTVIRARDRTIANALQRAFPQRGGREK